MRIGKQDAPFSAIATADAATITIRGKDLVHDLIGKIDFSAYFWFLVTGTEPTPVQRFFVDAALVSIAEHGMMPSVIAARMTYASGPEALQGAVAAGLLGSGSVILGSGQASGLWLAELIATAEREKISNDDAAAKGIAALRAERKPIPGFGHPLHVDGDPRADLLLRLADEKEVSANNVAMLRAVHRVLPGISGRSLPINLNGALPAVMIDVGFPLAALKGIALLGRTAGLIGHLQEEAERPIGFVLSAAAADAIRYDGERLS
jgi:citrate synthase